MPLTLILLPYTSRMKYSIGRAYLHLFSYFKNCNTIWPRVSENILCPPSPLFLSINRSIYPPINL